MKLNLGRNIKSLRRGRNLTQEQLAEHLGVSFQAVSRWERGDTYPELEYIPVLAKFFGVTVDDLFNMGEDIREKQAEALMEEIEAATNSDAPDINYIVSLIRDVRLNFIHCECILKIWTSVKWVMYQAPEIMVEMRLLFEDIMAKCTDSYTKYQSLYFLSIREWEENIEELMDRHSTIFDVSRHKLLTNRYRIKRDKGKWYIMHQEDLMMTLDRLIDELIDPDHKQLDIEFDPIKVRRAHEMCLSLLYSFCSETPDPLHPVSSCGELDIWVFVRIWIGLHLSAFMFDSGEVENGFIYLEDTVSLMEKADSLSYGAMLGCSSPWLPDIRCKVIFERDKSRGIKITSIMGPSPEFCHTYTCTGILYQLTDTYPETEYKFAITPMFEKVKDDPRFISCVERIRALT